MFAHLHCHFLGSYSDSLLDPLKVLPRVKEMGQEAIAITDHGELAFCPVFYRACRQAGLHPVIGCEFYFVEDARSSIEEGNPYRNHLVLLAKDNGGFLNLVRLNNASWLENSYREVRGLIDWKLLERFQGGLIALSACFWGSLPQKYITGGRDEAEKELGRYLEIFGEDFHPELGRHGIPEEEKANQGLIELSRRYGLKPVVTNDCHYLADSDWEAHDVLIKTRFGYPTDFQVDARNYFLKSEAEMRRLGFPDRYYDHTGEVARECRVDLDRIRPEIAPGSFQAEEAVFPAFLVTIDARQALEDAAGVSGEKKSELERGLALLPPGASLERSYRESAPFRKWMEERPKLLDLALKLEGLPRSSEPDFHNVLNLPARRLRECIPLKRSRGEIMAQYPLSLLVEIGLPVSPVASFRESEPAFTVRVERQSTLNEARLMFKRRDYAAAAVLLEGLIRTWPGCLEAHYLLGHSCYLRKRYRQAIAEYSFLEEGGFHRRKMPLVLTRRGWAHNWLGETPFARRSFEKALELEPDYSPALYALGVIDCRAGNYPESIRALSGFLRIKPAGPRAEKARALLQKMGAGPGDWKPEFGDGYQKTN